MTKSGVLYVNAENVRAHKILIAAKYSGANVKRDESFKLGETNKTADYLSHFPGGAVPGFKSSDDKYLINSNAIAYYVANDELRGKTEYDTARVLQWVNFAETDITPAVATWAMDKMGVKKAGKEVDNAKAALTHTLAVLDDYLRTRTYLVGERVTLADIACYTALHLAHQQKLFDAEHEAKFVNVHRWYTTCVNQPEAKAILSDSKSAAGGAKEAAKPAAKPAAKAAGNDEDDDGAEKKPAETDPFAVLPAGTFKMDEWKRTYSNNDFTTISLPYFWQNFDKANYSIWFAEYKPQYAKDLTQVFMTCNLVTGMYQRLDKMRKHSFGSMAIFGTKNDNTITGCWIWRGHDLAFNLSEDLQVDYESYDWRKVDADSDEAKQLVKDYFGRSDATEFKGKKLNQYFIFK